ncbi:MAG: hypothetical protein JWM80_934, partial [Cyanobacteria bacterium RYN_339]|nr:hypothetical protein [Cyanobacteria bacterium RYN_339]
NVGTFEIKQVMNYSSLDEARKASLLDAGAGLVSNDASKLDLVPGFTIVANVTTAAGSRFTTYRGYIYRYSLWLITSQLDRKAASFAAVQKDIDAMTASWFWQ